jgi:hypothetical protein
MAADTAVGCRRMEAPGPGSHSATGLAVVEVDASTAAVRSLQARETGNRRLAAVAVADSPVAVLMDRAAPNLQGVEDLPLRRPVERREAYADARL